MKVVSKMFGWWLARARTGRGRASTGVAIVMTVAGFSSGVEAGDPLPTVTGGSVFVFAFSWWAAWGVFGWFRNYWERRSRPVTPPFARVIAPQGSRSQLRHDSNARFFCDRGFMFRKRVWFTGTGCPPTEIDSERFQYLQSHHHRAPVAVARTPLRTWWFFEGSFYWENEGYESEDVKALIRQRERQRHRRLEHARALMYAEEDGSVRRREGIAQDVRMSVWKRDAGKCVECGRSELLEFDHVIPLALGGSNTERNLQLLCADCNRAKGPAL